MEKKYPRKSFLRIIVLLVLLSLTGCAVRVGDTSMNLNKFLPSRVEGWEIIEDDNIYTRETIFDYMNGAGEIYLGYDFQRLFISSFVKDSSPSIAVEIYQMASSEDAYGIFTHDMDGTEVNLGQGAIYSMGLLRFWKGPIFVRLMAEQETEETKRVLFELGRYIASSIEQKGKISEIVTVLPVDGLIKESIHYFHKPVSLNIHYYLADSNILGLNEKTEAILARYDRNNQKIHLLIIQYQTPDEAQKILVEFGRIYFQDKPVVKSSVRLEKIENDEFVGAGWLDRFVILIFEAKDSGTVEKLYQDVENKIQGVL